jgi:S1-C subfamily serine protease
MAQTLAEFSEALANAAERAARSTVLVDARARFPASGIAWAPGVVVTANHVVERENDILVGLPSGEEVPATLAGRDAGSDIAVLRVDHPGLEPADLAPEGTARVGHVALAIGRPTQGGHMASHGIVSAIGGPWRIFRGSTVQAYLRADVTMYPGFSGGPLAGAEGQVLGMNSSALARSGGLTIPPHAAEPIVLALLSLGRVRRGYLGVSTQVVHLSPALADALGGQASGLLVSGVEGESPAAAGGMLVGDILVRFGDAVIATTDDLQLHLGPERVGVEVALQVLRGGQLASLSIRVGERTPAGQ